MVCRAGCGEEQPAARNGQLVAVVGEKLYRSEGIPCFNINDASGVADFIEANYLKK